MQFTSDMTCNTLQIPYKTAISPDTSLRIDTGKVSIGKIEDTEKEIKQSKDKIDALIKILVQKNILTEEEILDIINSIELMEKLTENNK